MRAIRERGSDVTPGAGAIGGGHAEEDGSIVDLHYGIGFGGAAERQQVCIGNAIADHAAIGRKGGYDGRRRLGRVEREGEGGGGRDVAGEVGLPHVDGVGPLHQLARGRGAGAPVAAAVDRVLDRGPALHPGDVSEGSLVVLSLPEEPVSLVSATTGAAVPVSSVKENAVSLVLPATSVARTMTSLRPSTALKLLVKVVPPSTL